MRFYPSSYGTSRSAVVRRTREFNPCHDPKSGMFAPRGVGDCDEGDWEDPGRQRAIYGQMAEEKGALDLSKREVGIADEWLEATDDNDEARSAKREIAEALGEKLEEHPGFEKFAKAFGHEFPAYGDDSDGEYDWDSDPQNLKSAYDSDYESYRDDEMSEQRDAHRNEQESEFTEQRQKAKAAIAGKFEELKTIWDEVQAERPAGDVSEHPILPGLEDVNRSGKDLDAVEYFQDTLIPMVLDKKGVTQGWRRTTANWDGEKFPEHLDELDLDDPDVREVIKGHLREYTRSEQLDSAGPKTLANLYMGTYTIFAGDKDEAFDAWYDAHGGEPDYDDIKNFEEWYENEHGTPTSEDSSGGSTIGSAAASWLIKQWAETSGDGSADSVMLQEAANREFKLGATYTGQFTNRSADRTTIEKRLDAHGPVLQHFLRSMYDHTQAKLKQAGIEYVTLYRGFSVSTSSSTKEKGLSSVNKAGEFVDVLMQPMSSFASNFDTAQGFGGTSSNSFVMGVRVHRSQVIGTARTGFGCLNEHEWVLLGGRQPAYMIAPYSDEARKQHGTGQTFNYGYSQDYFWKGFEAANRRRKSPLTSGGVVVGPGDRL